MSGGDWCDIKCNINDLSLNDVDTEKQIIKVRHKIDQQIQAAFDEGVERGKILR